MTENQAHYLKTVLRRSEGSDIRVFNGRDGEFKATIDSLGKQSVRITPQTLIRLQPEASAQIHLFFCPIKKSRMDILIEKTTELGVTDFHPVLSDRTEMRKLNETRLKSQIIEAAEQCERMTLPVLHGLAPLTKTLQDTRRPAPLLWCRERGNAAPIKDYPKPASWAFLIGPEGGFTDDEIRRLENTENVCAVSLGGSILRSETAAIAAVSFAGFFGMT